MGQWSRATFPNGTDYYEVLLEHPRKIIFHTTFGKGSSGSPGFMIRNDKPCVVLIVRGGTPSCFYDNVCPGIVVNDNQKVEYGYAMSDIYKKCFILQTRFQKNLHQKFFESGLLHKTRHCRCYF